MRKSSAIGIAAALIAGITPLMSEAAPIGVPAATAGAGKTMLSAEVHVITDRDFSNSPLELESTQAFAKGTIGIDRRLDLELRLGFADFKADPDFLETDIGPAFGFGIKTTWATVPQTNMKIGSVFQATHSRVEEKEDSERIGFTELEAALGASFDVTTPRAGRRGASPFSLVPYAGLAWSGLDIDGIAVEDDTFGLFLGLQAGTGGGISFGAEVRLIDQTAISLNAGIGF